MQEMPSSDNKVIEEENNSKSKKEKFFTKRNILLLVTMILIVVAFVLFDQITKYFAVKYLTIGQEVNFLGDTLLVFCLTYNKGAAWGMGGNNTVLRILLVCISWAVALGIIGYFIYLAVKRKEIKVGLWIILSFVVAGDIGNLIDRTFFFNREEGSVVDFLSIQRWWKNFGIFNVADAILVVSIFSLLVYLIYTFIKEEIDKNKQIKEKIEQEKNGK